MHRAGILEAGVVKAIVDCGVPATLVHTDGYEYHRHRPAVPTELAHRIVSAALVGATCWLYPQSTSSSISPTPETGTAATSASA